MSQQHNPYLKLKVVEARIKASAGIWASRSEVCLTEKGQLLCQRLSAHMDSMKRGWVAQFWIALATGFLTALIMYWRGGKYEGTGVGPGFAWAATWFILGSCVAYSMLPLGLGWFQRRRKTVCAQQIDSLLSGHRGLFDAIEIVQPPLASLVKESFWIKQEWRLV